MRDERERRGGEERYRITVDFIKLSA
jgi:hypothetical protein